MGQYFKPVNLDTLEYLVSHQYGNGLKLMEHSYIGNNFVGAVERLLAEDGTWHMNRIVWAGDYGDEGLFMDNLEPKSYTAEHNGETYEYNVYSYVTDHGTEITPYKDMKRRNGRLKYLINHDKGEYVDLTKVLEHDGYRIHPLPLLTSNGNGRGGGDYRPAKVQELNQNLYAIFGKIREAREAGNEKEVESLEQLSNEIQQRAENMEPLVGSWAGDRISMASKQDKIQGLTEIITNFKE